MLLSDRDIKKALADGRIKLDPKPDTTLQLGSCSLDLTLGSRFSLFEPARVPYIDTRAKRLPAGMFRDVEVEDNERFIIHPSELVLAVTRERLELADDLVGRLEGRSSLARLGIIVHGTSNVFDAGWRGHPVLELGNIGRMPVCLYPRMRICSFTFEQLSSPAEVPYYRKAGNRFAGQTTPTASTPE